MEQASLELPTVVPSTDPDRPRLVHRARLLAGLGLGWHIVEAVIAVTAGAAAGSVALVGFGADSVVEGGAGSTFSGVARPNTLLPSVRSAERRG